MRPHETVKGKRRKRNHRIKCLRCNRLFTSINLKTNRICEACKQDEHWIDGNDA